MNVLYLLVISRVFILRVCHVSCVMLMCHLSCVVLVCHCVVFLKFLPRAAPRAQRRAGPRVRTSTLLVYTLTNINIIFYYLYISFKSHTYNILYVT